MSDNESDEDIKQVLQRYNTPELFDESEEEIEEPILKSQFQRQTPQWKPEKNSPRKPLIGRTDMTDIGQLVSELSIHETNKHLPRSKVKVELDEEKIRLDFIRSNKREKENGVDELVLSPVRRSTRLTDGVAYPSPNATKLLHQGVYFKSNPNVSIKGKVELDHYQRSPPRKESKSPSASPPPTPPLGSKVTLAKYTPSKKIKERLGTKVAVSPVRRSNRLHTETKDPLLLLDDDTGYVPNPDESVNAQWRGRSLLKTRR